MACGCAKNRNNGIEMSSDITIEPIEAEMQSATKSTPSTISYVESPTTTLSEQITAQLDSPSRREAIEINLKQCYLCAKKHIVRAQEFFQEYHTGYPDHIKNLVMSVRVAEGKVRQAFLLWQRIMGQLNMGEGELLGNNANSLTMKEEHISLANRIRTERIRLSDNPMYAPDFEQLLVDINILQYRVMGAE